MYNVMIVDDEIWTLAGLEKLINGDGNRFEVTAKTTDPMEAVELIAAQCPDVVFTDIRMPGMTGIELMQQVRERGIRTEFVVISGFAEFSYVRQAMEQGAIDYQLKPFGKEAVDQLLDKIYKRLEGKRKADDLDFYFQLKNGKNVDELLRDRFGGTFLDRFQAVLLYDAFDGEEKNMTESEGMQCLTLRLGLRQSVCIINSSRDKTRDLCARVERLGDTIDKAVISRSAGSGEPFQRLLKEVEETALDSFVYAGEKLFLYRECNGEIVSRLESMIADLCESGKNQQVKDIMLRLGKIFEENNMGIKDAVLLWNRIAALTIRLQLKDSPDMEYFNAYELTEKFTDIGEMGEYMSMVLCPREMTEQSGAVKDKFGEMLKYIDHHYEEDLSLRGLCDMFFINMSYCCVLFQRNCNMTFSQYLTEVRIRKACDLMKNYGVSVSETCSMVGYKDYFYFNKVFKKKMGCTPAEYRKGNGKES